jgi:hypothetical protein
MLELGLVVFLVFQIAVLIYLCIQNRRYHNRMSLNGHHATGWKTKIDPSFERKQGVSIDFHDDLKQFNRPN